MKPGETRYTEKPGGWFAQAETVEDFFNINIFFKCKININVSINDYSFKHVCKVCYL